jgi:hypothetical protein
MNAMEELRKLIAKWREIQKKYVDRHDESNRCFCHESCADELEALLPAIERLEKAVHSLYYAAPAATPVCPVCKGTGRGVGYFDMEKFADSAASTSGETREREGPLTPTGVELLERGVGMGLAWVWKNTVSLSEDDAEMLKQADPAQIVSDAEAKAKE